MAEFRKPSNVVLAIGPEGEKTEDLITEGTMTYMTPKKLVKVGASGDAYCSICGVNDEPIGVLRWNRTNKEDQVADMTTAHTAADVVAVTKGDVVFIGRLALGESVTKGAPLAVGANGTLVEALGYGTTKTKSIAFSKNTTAVDTGWNIPANAIVHDIIVEVVDEVAASTISVGTDGTSNQFLVAAITATAGMIQGGVTVTQGSNELYLAATTWGANFYSGFLVGTDVEYNVGTFVKKQYTSATATDLYYKTTDHDVAGFLHVIYQEPRSTGGVIARAEDTVDASSAESDMLASFVSV